jgi:hypothetical protein
MLANSIRWSGIRRSLPMPLAERLGGGLDHRRRSQTRREDQMMTECFGRLTALDEAVVNGLAVSLACSTERAQGR